MSARDDEDEFARFTVHSKTEIRYILNAMRESNSLVTVHFDHGNHFLLTSVVSVSDSGNDLILDCGSNAEMNKRVLQTDKLNCSSVHDKVKIQFTLHGVDPTKFDGRQALLADLPVTLIRLQRRDFYRMTTPVGNPLKCQIPIPLPDGGKRTIEATVADIGAGGLALVLPPEEHVFETDMLLSNVRIDLPHIGLVTVSIRVRSNYDLALASGKTLKRSGCQFINLPPSMAALIQRYIIQVERDRKARE